MTSSAHLADFDPSLIADRTYVTRRRFTTVDAPAVLSLTICLLTLFPAYLIVPGMTDLGRPALVVAFLLGSWWIIARLSPRLMMVGPQPIRWVALVYVLSLLISYAVGFLRGLTTMEVNAADRAMLGAIAFLGVMLIAADGIPNWERLQGVLRVFVWCSCFMAVIGLVQALAYIDLTQQLLIPGLQPKGWIVGLEVRGGGVRVASTAFHYIEFSLIMVMALPFAIHFARFAPTPRQRHLFAVAALLIAGAVPVTMSRTGFLALAVVLAVLFPVWGWRLRYNMFVVGVGLLAAMAVAKPDVMNTITAIFLDAENDPSVTARTKRYEMVGQYFSQTPWLGRGTGTWVSPQYQYLDNQWLGTALQNGWVGVAALASLYIGAVWLAGLALRRTAVVAERHLCACLIAVVLTGILANATFDAFSFSTYSTILALMLGLCGALWRFTHPARTVRTSAPLKADR
ncbi:O-antigen ligase family protein [Paractinoplanes maris]|uniref:O-antigen ligase family protein n=1 Tax=Paractinoplanes maris TaxID=1734446 RepID=UPI002022165E|nr:O-antigen ligase family protein [Actinoplanes maris]